jgi:hypothetical protein
MGEGGGSARQNEWLWLRVWGGKTSGTWDVDVRGGRCCEVLEPGGLCLSGLVGDVSTKKKRKKLWTD